MPHVCDKKVVIYVIMTSFRTSNQTPTSIIMWVQINSFTALWKAIVTHLAKTEASHEDRAGNGDRDI